MFISWYTAYKGDFEGAIFLRSNLPIFRYPLVYTQAQLVNFSWYYMAQKKPVDALVLLQICENLLTLGLGGGKVTNHVESTFGQVVGITVQDSLEGSNGVLEVDELALDTSEDLSDSEGLAQETLDLTGTLDGKLIGLRKFVHTQNSNDILETLVLLEDLLDTGGGFVVLLTDDTGVQHTRGRVERVDSGVDTQLGDTTRQDSGGVQMGEGGGGGRISQIVSRDVDGLDGSNGTLLGGGNTLLHTTHVDGKGGLVTDGRGNTSEKGRHLGTGLGETENVVNEEEHVLAFFVTEVLGDSQTSKGDTGTGTGGLVHLTENQGDLGLAVELNDGGLLHFVVQIVTLTGTLTDTSEDGVTTVSLGDVVDKLLNEHSLTDTGTTEQTNLTTTGVGSKQVDDLDTSDKDLSRGGLVNELRGVGVDRSELVGLDGTTLVNGVTSDVHDTAQSTGTDGDGDRGTSIGGLGTTDETLSTCNQLVFLSVLEPARLNGRV